MAPVLYGGRPLGRLYRLSEYGPWYFRARALLCNTVQELRDLCHAMLGEIEEMAARLRFPSLGKCIYQRMTRVESCYLNGRPILFPYPVITDTSFCRLQNDGMWTAAAVHAR